MKALTLLLLLFISVDVAAIPRQSPYDGFFERYTRRYLPTVDPDLLKAQCWQESRFKERAVSPVGAAGICQFMPGTWRDASKALGIPSSISVFHPEYNIHAAAYYMGIQHRTWRSPRPSEDRYNLAAASYNAGAGHLITAQRLCGGKALYREIIGCLPKVTGKHSAETIGYVRNIRGFYRELKLAKNQGVPRDGL